MAWCSLKALCNVKPAAHSDGHTESYHTLQFSSALCSVGAAFIHVFLFFRATALLSWFTLANIAVAVHYPLSTKQQADKVCHKLLDIEQLRS